MADVLSLALFFHDVRYQPEMSDNEEKSVALFRSLVPTSPEVQDRVASMILDTRTHDTSDPASQFLLDVDLSILGAPEADYQEYCRNIRREYDFVPDDTYRNGRIHVLTRFLEKSRIFFYIPHLEVPARRNIQTEIEALRRGQP